MQLEVPQALPFPEIKQPRPKKFFFLLPIVLLLLLGGSLAAFGLYGALQPKIPLVDAFDVPQPTPAETITQKYFWSPQAQSKPSTFVDDTTAKAALVFSLDSDKVYFAKNSQKRLPMASITKAMTALVVMEKTKLTDTVTVSDYAASVGENVMGITAGEQYSVDELLWGLFLQSGNDAAEALAEKAAGSKAAFVTLMNNRAIELGMNNTHFTNPYGLEGDGQMYTTANDLAIITKYVDTHFPQTFTYTKTIEQTLPATATHKDVYLSSEIDLIRTYPGAIGYKTGFTDEASRCIITVAENSGKRMVAIVLGSFDRRSDAVKLLDYAYTQEGIQIKHQPYW